MAIAAKYWYFGHMDAAYIQKAHTWYAPPAHLNTLDVMLYAQSQSNTPLY